VDLGLEFEADAHAEELLVQKLGSIRHIDPDDALCGPAEEAVGAAHLLATIFGAHDHVGHALAGLTDVHLREIA
jgi:hypothetical protein